MLTAMKVDRKT